MGTINIGSLALPVAPLALLGALFLGIFVARRAAHKLDLEPALWKIFLTGVLAARAAFVVVYFDSYRSAPLRMLDIRDGGFLVAAGLLAALATTAWYAWRQREGRKPLLLAVLAGLSLWGGALLTATVMEREASPLPELALERLEGGTVRLDALKGKPVVINLWATWCPPCRREMPALRDAQQRHPDVIFILANQREGQGVIRRYLDAEGLVLDNVLLDARGALGRMTGSQALPTTLFFAADGLLASRRIGELSTATLEQRIEALKEAR